jgi:transposase
MRRKRAQIKAKDFNTIVASLRFVLGIIFLLPIGTSWKKLIAHHLTRVMGCLCDSDMAKDSENSSSPPSKNIIKPARSREKGKRKIGGQDGHEGTTHGLDPNPTKRIDLTPLGLKDNPDFIVVAEIKRQVHDITIDKVVTEYSTLVFENTKTGERISGDFPEGVNAPVQFGDTLKGVAIYLREHQHLSYERLAELVNDMYGVSICEATLVNIIRTAESSPVLDDFEEAAVADITQSPCVNADETGISVNGKNHWVHILVGSMFTLFSLRKGRGEEAMRDIGLLQQLHGYVVHDCWSSYFKFTDMNHCLCNAHFVRELLHAAEMGSKWAELMREHLFNLHEEVVAYGGILPLNMQIQAVNLYRRIIYDGLLETGGVTLARPPSEKKKRGKMKKTKERNLLERMQHFEDAVLRFTTDKDIPFTNNDAERPVRMLKVHSKISGCFKTIGMAEGFCKIRSYIVTCKNNGMSAYESIQMIVKGQTPKFINDTLTIEDRKAA